MTTLDRLLWGLLEVHELEIHDQGLTKLVCIGMIKFIKKAS
jgi:hypothetical protein